MKPEYVKIGDTKYKINTDFRIALECNEIAENNNIGEYEKALAVIYKLFGDKGLEDKENHSKLLELGLKYLSCNQENKSIDNKEPSMDFKQDRGYIKASFLSDYGIMDIWSIDYMHFYDFMDYLNGLTEDSVLNRVRYIREYDISQEKDIKTRKKWEEAKQSVALKKEEKKLSKEQEESAKRFMELAKIN